MGRAKNVGNGAGSVVAIRRKGKIIGYAPEITIGWKDGKRIRKRGEVKKTRGEARQALETMKQLQQVGVEQLEKAQKVRDYFPFWLEKGFAPNGRGRSVDTYRWAIDKVIIPQLGDLLVPKISTFRLDALFADLLANGMAPRSVQLVRTVLNQAYKRAIKWKMVTHNPVTESQSIKIGRSNAKALSNDQVRAFLEATHGERLEVALRIALSLGLRRGEVCGLRWSDIDLERGILTVNGSLGWIKGKGLVYGPPKTESGRRGFRLPAQLVTALKRYQLRAANERKAAGDRWQASEYVFTSTKHGGALNPAQLWQAFRTAADRAGLTGFTLHSLRHSCASFLHAEGVETKDISAFLGHSDTQVTNDIYIHLFDDALSEVAAVVEARFGRLGLIPSESDN